MKHLFKSKILPVALGTLTAASFMTAKPAAAQVDPYIGQLMFVGYTFCPRAWTDANGQLLPISQNTALFSLYGTTFGGDGRTTFGVPDLRGRAPIHFGNGPGLQSYTLGQKGGNEGFTISEAQMPAHNHDVRVTDQIANKKGPGSDFLAKVPTGDESIYHNGPPNKVMDPAMLTTKGSSQEILKRSPYLAGRWCVALQGVYPSRN
jgi:microcystin-dependent protein